MENSMEVHVLLFTSMEVNLLPFTSMEVALEVAMEVASFSSLIYFHDSFRIYFGGNLLLSSSSSFHGSN